MNLGASISTNTAPFFSLGYIGKYKYNYSGTTNKNANQGHFSNLLLFQLTKGPSEKKKLQLQAVMNHEIIGRIRTS